MVEWWQGGDSPYFYPIVLHLALGPGIECWLLAVSRDHVALVPWPWPGSPDPRVGRMSQSTPTLSCSARPASHCFPDKIDVCKHKWREMTRACWSTTPMCMFVYVHIGSSWFLQHSYGRRCIDQASHAPEKHNETWENMTSGTSSRTTSWDQDESRVIQSQLGNHGAASCIQVQITSNIKTQEQLRSIKKLLDDVRCC